MQLTGIFVLILFGVAISGNDISETVVEPIIVGYLEYVEPPLLSIVNAVNTAVLGGVGATEGRPTSGDRRAVPPPRVMARIRIARTGDSIRRAFGWITQPSQVAPFPFNSDESRSLFRMTTVFRTIDRSNTEQLSLSRAAERVERELSPSNSIKIIEACVEGSAVPLTTFAKSKDAVDESSVKVSILDLFKVSFGPVMPATSTASKLLASLSLATPHARVNASNPSSLMPALAAVASHVHNGGYVFPGGTSVEFEAPSCMCFGTRGFNGIGVPPNTPLRFKVEFRE